MALFRRNDKTTIAELEDYYAQEKANRNGRAWAMAFLSLLITVAVIVALFFGVRWLWRTFVDDSESASTDSTEVVDVQLPSFDSDVDSGNSANVDNGTGTDGAVTDGGSSTSGGVVSDEAATTTRDVAGSTTNQPPSSATGGEAGNEATNNSGGEIPDTGTGELLIALPLAAGVIGYAVSLKRS